MKNESDAPVKTFLVQNLPWLLGIIFSTIITLASLYITSLILPLKQDIAVLAQSLSNVSEQVKNIQVDGSVKAQVNDERIKLVEGNIIEIKQGLLRIEEKLDNL